MRSTGRSKSDVDKWINDVHGIAAMIAADRNRLDYDANRLFTMVKPNMDYYYTLDASTLCAKRRLYQGTYNAIARELGNTPILEEDTIRIRNLLKEHGSATQALRSICL